VVIAISFLAVQVVAFLVPTIKNMTMKWESPLPSLPPIGPSRATNRDQYEDHAILPLYFTGKKFWNLKVSSMSKVSS